MQPVTVAATASSMVYKSISLCYRATKLQQALGLHLLLCRRRIQSEQVGDQLTNESLLLPSAAAADGCRSDKEGVAFIDSEAIWT